MVHKLLHTWKSLGLTDRILIYIAFIITLAIFAWAIELRAGV